ncbi:membrane hypothetical protein [Microcystis aeruginosa PCC 9807]|uniref:Uncharacterized protein n=1 Tax=Microcystis aeruginosa PCC 9807 TaxID=1160283 RepID=I4H026_MICAE|nr:hypothetical protein [Microcystis aeruginosa]CCI15400.1 membrane hypothetical protein [Microcystis aeruginosa PCC 9807]
MNLPVILDVGIGLIIIYISAALIVSGVQEAIAALFQWRSQHLKESILQIMLGQDVSAEEFTNAEKMRDSIYENPLIQSMNHTSVSWGTKGWNLGNSFINDLPSNLKALPSKLKSLFSKIKDWVMRKSAPSNENEAKSSKELNKPSKEWKKYQKLYLKSLPSYIDKEDFATALIYQLVNENSNSEKLMNNSEKLMNINTHQDIIKLLDNDKIPKSLRDSLIALADRAQNKVKDGEKVILSFQKEIENWFDCSMARASGIYKRNTQLVCLVLAFLIVIFFNLDSVNIAQKLFNDSTLRSLLVDGASNLVVSYKTDPNDPNSQLDTKELEKSINQIFGNSLPIVPIYENAANFINCPDKNNCPLPGAKIFFSYLSYQKFVLAFIGWMVTTLAVYMGAPFWFQLLIKLVNIRSTGSRPKSEQ